MTEKTFKVKDIQKILDENGKVKKVLITLDATDKTILTSSENIIVEKYTVQQRS